MMFTSKMLSVSPWSIKDLTLCAIELSHNCTTTCLMGGGVDYSESHIDGRFTTSRSNGVRRTSVEVRVDSMHIGRVNC